MSNRYLAKLIIALVVLMMVVLPGSREAIAIHSELSAGADWQGGPPVAPEPVAFVSGPASDDIANILLLGSDTSNPANAGRTDTIMIVSINRTREQVSLLSFPRDLYVFVPPSGEYQRINTVFGMGEHGGYEGGGYGLLKTVIRFNFGLHVDWYARVDFNGFQAVVDALGGVEVTVPCALQDWALKAPGLDPQAEENWELKTLSVGVHNLDGYEALWYARSRRTSSDFDRGRRQQDIVRAMWRKANALGLVGQMPALWGELDGIVRTDMTLPDWLGLLPTALRLDSDDIRQFRFEQEVDVHAWRTPNGEAVQIPDREQVSQLIEHFMQPAADSRLNAAPVRIEIVNASGVPDMDHVVFDMLSWRGLVATVVPSTGLEYQRDTTVIDYYGSIKGSRLPDLLDALRIDSSQVVSTPSAERLVEYRVVLGGDFRSCQFAVLPPVAIPAVQD